MSDPNEKWGNRPINPNRDARVAAALERGDPDAAWHEFTREPEPPKYPIPPWCQCWKRVVYRNDPNGPVLMIMHINGDPQHAYEFTLQWEENEQGLTGSFGHKWLTNTGEPDFEATFAPAPDR